MGDEANIRERLITCRKPLLAEDEARKREEILRATEKRLDETVAATKEVRSLWFAST